MEEEIMFTIDQSGDTVIGSDFAEADTEKYLLFLADSLLFGAKAE